MEVSKVQGDAAAEFHQLLLKCASDMRLPTFLAECVTVHDEGCSFLMTAIGFGLGARIAWRVSAVKHAPCL
jgi:hypothetical protein